MTIDALAGGGRMIIGLGVSGPQIVEGCRATLGEPTARLRDYITILRKVIARTAPSRTTDPRISAALHRSGALGQGKPLKSIPLAVRHPDLAGVGRPAQHRVGARSCATAGSRWGSRRGHERVPTS